MVNTGTFVLKRSIYRKVPNKLQNFRGVFAVMKLVVVMGYVIFIDIYQTHYQEIISEFELYIQGVYNIRYQAFLIIMGYVYGATKNFLLLLGYGCDISIQTRHRDPFRLGGIWGVGGCVYVCVDHLSALVRKREKIWPPCGFFSANIL